MSASELINRLCFIKSRSRCGIIWRIFRERIRDADNVEAVPDLLAFAEGRLLSIHPFADFNGRAARLWLWELLFRLRLPPVKLAPLDASPQAAYIDALRAADQRDYQPLANLWRSRLANAAQ